MIKHATVSNDVMSKLSDIPMYLIVLNDFVSLKNSFFMSLKIILTCVQRCYAILQKQRLIPTTHAICSFFFLLVLDVKAFSTLLTIKVLTHLKTSGHLLSVNDKT